MQNERAKKIGRTSEVLHVQASLIDILPYLYECTFKDQV